MENSINSGRWNKCIADHIPTMSAEDVTFFMYAALYNYPVRFAEEKRFCLRAEFAKGKTKLI